MVIGTPTVLNLIPGGVMKIIHVNQVNENIEIQFRIMNGAQPFNVPEGVSCTIRGTKGDNFGYAAAVAVTAGSNVVTVTLTEQLTAVAGTGNVFELVFVGSADDMKVSTENFKLAVERAALGEDTVISDSDLAYADQVLDQLQSVGAVNAQVQQNKANIAAEIARATAADNTLQNNINAEASTRAAADQNLQAQISQIVAPSGEAPSAAEVQNARVGADGVTYPTLGDAIRANDSQLNGHLEMLSEGLNNEPMTPDYSLEIGYINSETGQNVNLTDYVRTVGYIPVLASEVVITVPDGYRAMILTYDEDKSFIENLNWNTGTYTKTINAAYIRVTIGKTTATDISVALVSGFGISEITGISHPIKWAIGTVFGFINYDTTAKTISVPLGRFFDGKTANGFDVAAATLSTASLSSWGYVLLNYTTKQYEIVDYRGITSLRSYDYALIMAQPLNYPNQAYSVSPFGITLDGYSQTVADKTLSKPNVAADAQVTGRVHTYGVGIILGTINIDTSAQTITIPAGLFFNNGDIGYKLSPGAVLDYSNSSAYPCVLFNNTTYQYELMDFSDYRRKTSLEYQMILMFAKARPTNYTCIANITVDGEGTQPGNADDVPAYWRTELNSVIDDVALLQTYSSGVTFGFITDIHWDVNFRKSPELIKYIADHSRVNMWLNGGDTASGDGGDGTTQLKLLYECVGRYNGDFGFYSVNGNHDDNHVGSSTLLTSAEIKNVLMPYGNDITFGNGNYYWFDYRGTRFVCLDTGAYGNTDAAQIAWAANVIANSTLPVIICMHIVFIGYTDANPCQFFNDLITAIGSNSNVKMIIAGHLHHDRTYTASNGIPVIMLDTDSKSTDDGINRVEGTITEQCLSIVTIDYGAKVIHVNRVGGIGSDITVTY